jgi:hypothetical protein
MGSNSLLLSPKRNQDEFYQIYTDNLASLNRKKYIKILFPEGGASEKVKPLPRSQLLTLLGTDSAGGRVGFSFLDSS